MTLELISFALAVLLGLMTFALVKHTADEFDRWYDDVPAPRRSFRLPRALVSAIAVAFGAVTTILITR